MILSRKQVVLLFIVILIFLLQYTNFTLKRVIRMRKNCCFYYCCKIVERKEGVGFMIPIRREKNWGNTTACVLNYNHIKIRYFKYLRISRESFEKMHNVIFLYHRIQYIKYRVVREFLTPTASFVVRII